MSILRTAALGAALIAVTSLAFAAPKPTGIDLSGIDHSVAPGDDFSAYANGAWDKKTEIPGDLPAYGSGFVLVDKTNEQVRGLIQDAANSNPAPGSDAQKAGDF